MNSRFSTAETNGACLIQHNSQIKRTYAVAYALFIWLLVFEVTNCLSIRLYPLVRFYPLLSEFFEMFILTKDD